MTGFEFTLFFTIKYGGVILATRYSVPLPMVATPAECLKEGDKLLRVFQKDFPGAKVRAVCTAKKRKKPTVI